MENQRKVIALGFFDGVHMGHGALLRTVAERAMALDAVPCAFTFDRSPAAALTGKAVPLLSGVDDRERLMHELYGIRKVIVAPFDVMRQMDWQDFVAQYLQRELGVVHVVAGHDFHFGYKGQGSPQRLVEKCKELSMGCDIIPKVEIDGFTVSSTYIRSLVQEGKMERARWFLGHPHTLSGTVVHGSELGRTLGTPTANLLAPEGVISPGFGVYATKVYLSDGERLAVTNVGTRPTVNSDKTAVTVEPWILDYHGDLYGKDIRVEFYTRLRPERKFHDLQALREAILENARQTRDYFAKTSR